MSDPVPQPEPGPEPTEAEQLGLPDLDVEADPGADDLENQSGLGKGLSAIIPQLSGLDEPGASGRNRGGGIASLIPEADDEHPPAVEPDGAAEVEPEPARPEPPVEVVNRPRDLGAVRQLRDDLIRALLDGLVNTIRLDLCAYVHVDRGGEPALFLRAPALATLGPQRAWALFHDLREASARERTDSTFSSAGLRGLLVPTGGARSTGLFALGRVDGLTEREHGVAERFCTSFGRAVHQLAGEHLDGADGDQVLVEIHEARDSLLARVRLPDGIAAQPGSGRASTRVEAVTRAVVDGLGSDAVFRYASEVAHGGEHAGVVLLEGPDGSVGLGSAVTRSTGAVATANAARRAVEALEARAQPT